MDKEIDKAVVIASLKGIISDLSELIAIRDAVIRSKDDLIAELTGEAKAPPVKVESNDKGAQVLEGK